MDRSGEVSALHYDTGKPVKIKFSDGLISSVEEIPMSDELNDIFVAPGLIDNQINGYRGVDFSDPSAGTLRIRMAVDAIRKDGVTSFFPTIITGSHDNLVRIFRNLARALQDDEEVRTSVAGFHLEGPYISPEAGYYGCHPAEFIRKPSWDEFMQYQDAAAGNIRQVTVSPEIEGAMDFIGRCVRQKIIVSIGHTNASASQILEAVDRGARLSTHLGNGCANLIDRHRNPIWPQLANDLLTPSIIADGHHLLPEEVKVFCQVKGPDNIILTSDVTHFIGMEPGNYVFLGSDIVLSADGLIKNPVLNCLAGASLPLKTGVGNVMRFTGYTLGEAVNLASRNVTAACRITGRGKLEGGMRADLILFHMENFNMSVKKVIVNGREIGSQSEN
ncbi:MAG: N-acetylglucosamine-6-phosphate deacetylase [Bacteroidales bacterium]|nr:N-acetylglucosamine-6-phosphate deacetylase [Bacteroidales bacterium]